MQMMTNPPAPLACRRNNAAASTATVSLELVQDLLQSLQALCSEATLDHCLKQAGIVREFISHPGARLTHDQFVGLYRKSAGATGDEMMGLWSRPIRTGSLKYIMRSEEHTSELQSRGQLVC